MNLDVDAPDKVSDVLRAAATAYYESEAELSSGQNCAAAIQIEKEL